MRTLLAFVSLIWWSAPAASQTLPWKSVVPQPRAGAPRIILMYDMEGLSGVSNGRMVAASYPEFAHGRERLVADVNAVIDGLFAGGAASVTVEDFHGSGNEDGPDLPADRLHPRATYIDPRALPSGKRWNELGLWDALVFVGMHEATGVFGFLSHTRAPGMDHRINGESLTETEWLALQWGSSGIPVIFVSGDDQLGLHLRRVLPWITYVETKRAVTRDSAAVYNDREFAQGLRNGATNAMQRFGEARAVTVEGPIKASLRAFPPANLSVLRGVPGVNYADQEVSFEAADLSEAFSGLAALQRIAVTSYWRGVLNKLEELPGGKAFSAQAWDAWAEGGRQAAGNALRRRYESPR